MAKTAGVTRQQVETDIRKRNFSPIYLLMGEESFFIDRLSEMIVKYAVSEDEKDFNLTTFYGGESATSDIILTCRKYPMMAERQVVLLKEAQSAKTGKQINWNLLQQYALQPTDTTILVICHRGGNLKAASFIKAIKQCGGVVFESAALNDYNVGKAVSDYVAEIGCKIDLRAQEMLIEHVGFNMSLLAKEIDKLKLTLPAGAMITTEAVAENTGISKEFNSFELTAAIATRNKVKAFQIAKYFRANPSKNKTMVVLPLVFNLFSNTLIAYYTRTNSERDLMEALRFKAPIQLRDVRSCKNNYNARQVLNAIHYIREFDAKCKGIGSKQGEFDLFDELMTKIFNC